MNTLELLYFFKITLLPGLATIRLFCRTRGIDWTEVFETPNATELNGPLS